jgi:hypothetical protein
MSPTSRHDLHGGDPALLLEEIGDGIGVVDRAGELLWMNHRLEALAPESMRRFCEACRDLLSELAEDGTDRRTHLRTFRSGDRTWEIDRFDGLPVVLAECELPSVDAPLEIPAWLAPWIEREVTEEPAFRNFELARRAGLLRHP